MNYIIKFPDGTYLNPRGAVKDEKDAFLFGNKLSAKIYLSTTLENRGTKGEIVEISKSLSA